VCIVVALDKHGEFIAADAENGAVPENIADDFAGALNVLIAGLMSLRVVDLFQVVDIENYDGKRRLRISSSISDTAMTMKRLSLSILETRICT